MSDFPSWIVGDGENHREPGFIYFNTDKDLKEHKIDYKDGVGHDAIRKVWGNIQGYEREGFPCPKEIVDAIRNGKCHKMMIADGCKEIHFNEDGQLHNENGPAIIHMDKGKEWYLNGKIHKFMYNTGATYVWNDYNRCWKMEEYMGGKCEEEFEEEFEEYK